MTFLIFVLVVLGMAIGVIFSNRQIKGSCGGLNNIDGLDSGDCMFCSNKKCKKQKLEQAQ
jgi:hypothetical protein